MKPILILSSLTASLLLIPVLTLNSLAQSEQWLGQVTGKYESEVESGDRLITATTTFVVNDQGALIGSYELIERDDFIPGTLNQCRGLKVGIVQCIWSDRYGTGKLTVTFSEDFSRFDGYWTPEGEPENYLWRGYR